MEWLGPKSLSTVKIEEAIRIVGRLLRRLAVPAGPEFRSQDLEIDSSIADIKHRWEKFAQPFPRSVLDRVVNFADSRRGRRTSEFVLVNYDLHYDNILAGAREPWLAIDPKVIVGDLEFGVAQLFWNRLEEIEASAGLERHFRALVESASLNEPLAREWTLVRTVDYWLWGLSVGFTEDPVRCRRIVEWLS